MSKPKRGLTSILILFFKCNCPLNLVLASTSFFKCDLSPSNDTIHFFKVIVIPLVKDIHLVVVICILWMLCKMRNHVRNKT